MAKYRIVVQTLTRPLTKREKVQVAKALHLLHSVSGACRSPLLAHMESSERGYEPFVFFGNPTLDATRAIASQSLGNDAIVTDIPIKQR